MAEVVYEDLSRDTQIERVKRGFEAYFEERRHLNVATLWQHPDGSIRSSTTEFWPGYLADTATNILTTLCDSRRFHFGNIANPPDINRGIAYVSGNLVVTQQADPVWDIDWMGRARVLQEDDPLREQIMQQWVDQKIFSAKALRNYLTAHGGAVGSHTVAVAEITDVNYMNGLTDDKYPRYVKFGPSLCVGQPRNIMHAEPYEHAHYDQITDNLFEYLPDRNVSL